MLGHSKKISFTKPKIELNQKLTSDNYNYNDNWRPFILVVFIYEAIKDNFKTKNPNRILLKSDFSSVGRAFDCRCS